MRVDARTQDLIAHQPFKEEFVKIEPGKYGFPVEFKKRYANYIGGEWADPAAGQQAPVLLRARGRR